ncbi:unnamed protein product [Psylliodes chrysocephalus]|uniref:Regulatory protein zeste n=1 Tax=Psylliodes chrysocephalus TaxID=3402493 RepID=A0A9P0DAS7_9CUCU|nr:unnamed protein product [Psylliodes chrysocephala]
MWEKVTKEFNCMSPGNNKRSTEVLKIFYENNKKKLRKKTANKKIHIKGTGGGPPDNIKDDPTNDLLLSIMNEKTVYGLKCSWGEMSLASLRMINLICLVPVIIHNKNVEIVYENIGKSNSPPSLATDSYNAEIINEELSQDNVFFMVPVY